MLASQRKQQILQILTEEKQVMSGELSQRFNVSEDSIRRRGGKPGNRSFVKKKNYAKRGGSPQN